MEGFSVGHLCRIARLRWSCLAYAQGTPETNKGGTYLRDLEQKMWKFMGALERVQGLRKEDTGQTCPEK